MDMTAAVHVGDGSSTVDVVEVDGPEIAGLGLWRTLALIAFSALSAGGFFTLMKNFAEPNPGSAAEATEQLLRRPEEPAAIAAVVVIVLMVAIAGTAAAVALGRHAE